MSGHSNPPTPSSLREQIHGLCQKIGSNAYAAAQMNSGWEQTDEVDQIMSLVASYIEATTLEARSDELIQMCRKYRQRPIPERAMLDRIKELIDPNAVAQFIASDDYHGLIEAAEIDRAIKELEALRNKSEVKEWEVQTDLSGDWQTIPERIKTLQAQKAVLESKDE